MKYNLILIKGYTAKCISSLDLNNIVFDCTFIACKT